MLCLYTCILSSYWSIIVWRQSSLVGAGGISSRSGTTRCGCWMADRSDQAIKDSRGRAGEAETAAGQTQPWNPCQGRAACSDDDRSGGQACKAITLGIFVGLLPPQNSWCMKWGGL